MILAVPQILGLISSENRNSSSKDNYTIFISEAIAGCLHICHNHDVV